MATPRFSRDIVAVAARASLESQVSLAEAVRAAHAVQPARVATPRARDRADLRVVPSR